MTRRACRVDGPHGAIRDALRAVGCKVYDCSGVGGDFPDLLVRVPGYPQSRLFATPCLLLLEVKDGTLSPSRRKLKPGQEQFRQDFAPFVIVVESVEDALNLVGK